MDHHFRVDFLGIGAQKAASGWLARCLKCHPEIAFSRKKETCFFFFDDRWERGLSYYRSFFPPHLDERTVGEFSPAYLTSETCARRIADTFPDARLIAVLRHPIERARSQIRHLLAEDKLAENSFDQAVLQYPSIVELGEYGRGLTQYFRLFNREQILVIKFSAIREHPETVVADVYRHVGVDPDFRPPRLHVRNKSTRARTSPLFQFIHRTYQTISDVRGSHMVLEAGRWMGFDAAVLTRLGELTGHDISIPFEIPADRLAAHYRPDIERLEELLGWDLSEWKHPPPGRTSGA